MRVLPTLGLPILVQATHARVAISARATKATARGRVVPVALPTAVGRDRVDTAAPAPTVPAQTVAAIVAREQMVHAPMVRVARVRVAMRARARNPTIGRAATVPARLVPVAPLVLAAARICPAKLDDPATS